MLALQGWLHITVIGTLKTWQTYRYEQWLKRWAISYHLALIQCLGHQPAGTWQPREAGMWAEGTGVGLDGQVPPDGGCFSAPALAVVM